MKRRQFVKNTLVFPLIYQGMLAVASSSASSLFAVPANPGKVAGQYRTFGTKMTMEPLIHLFLCGDVMTGRGIDQILPNPSEPRIYEPYVRNAQDYVYLAEKRHGFIHKPVSFDYIWGDALEAFSRLTPDVRIINLETSITTNNQYWPGKGIQYRMHPDNIACLTAADIDICTLANNHVLDWHYAGLRQTLSSLHRSDIQTAGAGINRSEAEKPAVFDLPGKGRVLVFAYADRSSGTPLSWQASTENPGVNLLADLSTRTLTRLARMVHEIKTANDIAIASIHWGGNWGYEIDPRHRQFAHELIDQAGFDIIHGHSSHHPKGIEVYQNRPIIYGCGDFLNDYEGISGQEHYRGDLGFMYFVTINATSGELHRLHLIPTQIRQLCIHYAGQTDRLWLQQMLNREGQKLGTRFHFEKTDLILSWE